MNPNNGRSIDGSVSTLNLAGTTTTQTPGTATAPGWTNPNNAKVIDTATATLTAGSVNTTQTAGTAATTQTAGVNDFGTTGNATGAPNSTLSSTTLSNTSSVAPGSATSSTVSGAADFTTTANATGTINGTYSTSTYANGGSGSVTLAGAAGFDNAPTAGFNSFTGPANAEAITGGTMTGSNSASYTSNAGSTTPGELRMTGYPDVPAGVVPTNVTLTVRHQESSTSPNVGVSVIVQDVSNNTLCTVTVPTQTSTNPASPFVSVNLGPTASGGTNCLSTATQINGVKLDYQVTKSSGSRNTTVSYLLDGMSLAVTYTGDTANRTLALSAFAPQLANPANTTVDAATLSVSHKETVNSNPQLVLSGVNIPAANTACTTIALTPSTVGATDSVNLLSRLTTTCGIAAANIPATINGLTATYVTHLSAAGTATVNLDGVNLALTATDTTVRTLTLSNISPTVSTSATNVIDKATLSFAHQEQTGATPTVTLVVTPGGGGTCSFPLSIRNSLTTETIDVTSCLNTPAKLNGATYAYQVHLVDSGNISQSVTVSVDGMSVAVIATDTANQTVALSAPAPAVPTGVTVDSSSLSFAHREAGGTANPRLVLSGVNITGNAGCNTIALTPQPTLATDTVNMYTQLTTNCGIAPANVAATLNGLTVTYTANLAATAGDGATQCDQPRGRRSEHRDDDEPEPRYTH